MNTGPLNNTKVHSFNHVGVITIDGSLLRERAAVLQKIYSRVIPIEVTYDPQSDYFYVTCLSGEFKLLSHREIIPEYKVIITETPFGELIEFKGQK